MSRALQASAEASCLVADGECGGHPHLSVQTASMLLVAHAGGRGRRLRGVLPRQHGCKDGQQALTFLGRMCCQGVCTGGGGGGIHLQAGQQLLAAQQKGAGLGAHVHPWEQVGAVWGCDAEEGCCGVLEAGLEQPWLEGLQGTGRGVVSWGWCAARCSCGPVSHPAPHLAERAGCGRGMEDEELLWVAL